jgi:hypothetical protein
MSATAAHLVEYVLPRQSGLRQWVLTFPFAWRSALARDGALLGSLGVGDRTVLVLCAIGDRVILAGQVGVAGNLTIGDGAVVTAQSGIASSVEPGGVVSGSPSFDNRAPGCG